MGSQIKNHELDEGKSAEADALTQSIQAAGGIVVPFAGDGSSRGASGSASNRRGAGAPSRDDKTRISKRSPAVELPALKPALNPFELGRTLEGERLGHFQLEKFVGGGGMGAVFRAADTMLGRIVAVKVLSRDQTEEDTLRRFQNEAQSAARLDHPNIARVYYVGEDRSLHYIVFEFIEGVNIRDLVADNGPMPVGDALHYTLQVAEALDHASQRDVVHRDIKPSNVLVMPDGHVKLVDMGLARLHQVEATEADLTASGVTLGTFDYISPEQARDPRSADVRSDLYSLGCTLFYMLTGRAPFPMGTVLQKLLSHSSETPPDVRTLREGIDDEVAGIVNKLLAKHPSQRHQTPSELIGALILAAEHLGIVGVGQRSRFLMTPTEPPFLWMAKHLPWAVPAALLLSIVLIARWLTPNPETVPLEQMRPTFHVSQTKVASPDKPSMTPPSPLEPPAKGLRNGTETKSPTKESTSKPGTNSGPTGSTNVEGGSTLTNANRNGKSGTDSIASAGSARVSPANSENGNTEPPKTTNAGTSEGGSGSTKNETEGTTTISVLVLDDGLGVPAAGTKRVKSLAEAFRLASESKDISTIQLSYNGERNETAFDLPVRGLEIRAGNGFQPVVTFKPLNAELSVDRHMLRAIGGQFVWRGIHFRMELPTDPYDNWSLFQVAAGTGLEFTDCTLTIRNANDKGTILQNQVSFIQLVPPMVTDTKTSDDREMMMTRTLPSAIEFLNCIARGQAVLVESPEALPFRLLLNQMLFASTERLVECGGTSQQPTLGDAVQIDLRHVTAFVGEGLCYTKIDQQGPFPLELVVNCQNSIVLTGTKYPLIQQRGTTAQPYRKRPRIRGVDNFYPNTSVILSLDATGNPDDFVEYTFSERDEAREEKWYDDRPEPGLVTWKNPPRSSRRVDLHNKADYQLDEGPNNKALNVAGFTPSLLPNLTDAPLSEATVPPAEPALLPANE